MVKELELKKLDLEGANKEQLVRWLFELFKEYDLDDNRSKIFHSVMTRLQELHLKDNRKSGFYDFLWDKLTPAQSRDFIKYQMEGGKE